MTNDLITTENKSSSLSTIDENTEWSEIVNRLVDELSKQDLPEKVIQATELLLVGMPLYKVAKKLDVSSKTVRRWLSQYPTMAAVVSNGRKLLSTWRMAQLEQQFQTALERNQEILELELNGISRDGVKVDPKVLTVVAAQARYMIGLFAGQRMDITVKHELGDTVMKAQKDAYDYIAEQLAKQREGADLEPIEAVYRVIDNKVEDTGPVLDEQGQAPFGQIGVLSKTDDGILCHICGERFKSFSKHLLTKHNTSTDEYEMTYMLGEGSVRKAEGYWKTP